MTYADALTQAGNGKLITVTIVSNQDNGIVSYMTGNLGYFSTKVLHPVVTTEKSLGAPASGNFLNGGPLSASFSDRFVPIPSAPGTLTSPPVQPFNINQTDQVGINISESATGALTAEFTLITWGNAKFSVPLQVQSGGDLLYGSGQATGNNNGSKPALYTIAFTGAITPETAPK